MAGTCKESTVFHSCEPLTLISRTSSIYVVNHVNWKGNVVFEAPLSKKRMRQAICFILDSFWAQMNATIATQTKFSGNAMKLLNHNATMHVTRTKITPTAWGLKLFFFCLFVCLFVCFICLFGFCSRPNCFCTTDPTTYVSSMKVSVRTTKKKKK